jgi:hypothetical protein
MAATLNLDIYQGDTFTLSFTVAGDYTAHAMRMDIASTFSAASIIALNETAGISAVYSAPNTTVTITIQPVDTADLSPSTTYVYDFQTILSGVVQTWFAGTIGVTAEVTN